MVRLLLWSRLHRPMPGFGPGPPDLPCPLLVANFDFLIKGSGRTCPRLAFGTPGTVLTAVVPVSRNGEDGWTGQRECCANWRPGSAGVTQRRRKNGSIRLTVS